MSLSKIKSALLSAYSQGAFLLPTAYENVKFTPNNGKPWAAVTIVPNVPDVATLGPCGCDEHTGFFQIALYYPLNTGDGAILAKADEIHHHFKTGKRLEYQGQYLTVKRCGRSQGREINGMYQIILTINWTALTMR